MLSEKALQNYSCKFILRVEYDLFAPAVMIIYVLECYGRMPDG